jgi:hypothetical protein
MVYTMVYTIWYIASWYIPSKSGIYHEATFQMFSRLGRDAPVHARAARLASVRPGHELGSNPVLGGYHDGVRQRELRRREATFFNLKLTGSHGPGAGAGRQCFVQCQWPGPAEPEGCRGPPDGASGESLVTVAAGSAAAPGPQSTRIGGCGPGLSHVVTGRYHDS